MKRASASAKINLALVVGPLRDDGLHEVVTVLQRIDIADRIELEPARENIVTGFAGDTLVRRALDAVSAETGERWRARIEKSIPVAAGLGGGSSDAATALALAGDALPRQRLHDLAASLGSDVPFFLTDGPQLATGTGTDLAPLELPQDFWVVVLLPDDTHKASTASVYADFDAGDGFEERRAALLDSLAAVRRPTDLAALPPNDLAHSQLARELLDAGAFRADVSGAGPAVYGLFVHERAAHASAAAFESRGRTWVTAPAWYG
ncbi:MAG: 4-(cytidine 5'-diphospho)-2-C-methyl-D-erythritol kinase [Gaiellaceae bacterium]